VEFLSTPQYQEHRYIGMEEETDLAHLGSQVQGTDGPGVGADLDVQSSRTGLIETHLPIPVACGYCPMPQLHGRARDPKSWNLGH